MTVSNLDRYSEAAFYHAVNKFAEKKIKEDGLRDYLQDSSNTELHIALKGKVDEVTLSAKSAKGILTVGRKQTNVTPSNLNKLYELIGLLLRELDKNDRSERKELTTKLTLNAMPLLEKVNPIYTEMARQLCEDIRRQKDFLIEEKAGSVSFKFKEKL